MINPRNEKLLSIRQLGREIGYGYNAVYRLAKEGVMGVDGKIHRLDIIVTPQGMKTTLESYYRFLEKLNEC